jgi:cobaltochelatase CobT
MLTRSPIALGLIRRFAKRRDSSDEIGYQIFTTAFDEVVDAEDLPRILPKQTVAQTESFEKAVASLEKEFTSERVVLGSAAAQFVRELQSRFSDEERTATVVSFLIDHSGSMRGLPMLSAILAVEASADALTSLGISTEILGFTTVGWKGSKSRRAWQWAGKPLNPGRLCDIRHIVYGAADRSSKSPWHLRLALRPDLLHENIDGEALEWAGERLNTGRWQRRIICVISDGVPIDDSTLLANAEQNLLTEHLKSAELRLRDQGVVVGFLLLGKEDVREPELYERASEPTAAGLSLLKLIQRALTPHDNLMHDWTLVSVDLDWAAGLVRLGLRAASLERQIVAHDLIEFSAPRRQEWGPSRFIYSSKGPTSVQAGSERLEIQMQSGDVIVIVARKIQMPEPVDQRLFTDRIPIRSD